jgi:paraquat-inducible protein B
VPGRRFVLHADALGSADRGSPVYCQGIRIGQVLGYALDADRCSVTFEVFVDAPRDRLVRDPSRFWNASGIDVSVTAGGFDVATESLQTIIAGGIAFDTPGIEGPGEAAAPGHEFQLHPSKREIDKPPHDEDILGPVEIRGSCPGSPVIRGVDGTLRADRRPMGEDGAALPREEERPGAERRRRSPARRGGVVDRSDRQSLA